MSRAFAVVCALAWLGCAPKDHTVIVRFDPASLGEATEQIELSLVASCQDQFPAQAAFPVRPQAQVTFDRDSIKGLGEVTAKHYGVYAVAIAGGCRIGAGCKNVGLDGNSQNILVVIEPAQESTCVVPPDAGMDGGDVQPEAGTLDGGPFPAGTELALSFDSADGGVVILDESNNAYIGTLASGATIDENGHTGSGLHLPGGSAVLEFDDILPLTEEITVEAWVRPELFMGWATIINRYLVNTGYWLGTTQDGTGIAFWVDLVFAAQIGIVELETWTHVAGTFDAKSGELLLYVNGVQTAMAVHEFPVGIASTPLSIGNKPRSITSNDLRPFTGGIDDVRIFESVRAPEQICADAGGTWNGSLCVAATDAP